MMDEKNTNMKLYLYIFFALLPLFSCSQDKQSSGDDSYRYATNEKIPAEVKASIHALDSLVLVAIQNGDTAFFQGIMSSRLKENSPNLSQTLRSFQQFVPAWDFEYKDEYWIRNAVPGTQHPVISRFMTYYINHESQAEEEYITLNLAEDSIRSFMILSIYTRKADGWELDAFRGGNYSVFGKTGLDYLEESQDELSQGHIFNAYFNILLAKDLGKPCAPYFQYSQERDLLALEDSLVALMNTDFLMPISIKEVLGNPEIMGAQPQVTDEGFVPLIFYETDISLEDKPKLEKQCDQIHEQIESIFPGVLSFSPYVFYRVFNRETKSTGRYYGFVKKRDE
ncbi:MAG: hypothetical protein AAFO96_28945 [Bacteroidota bacterium]